VINYKPSKNLKAIQSRIRRLPELVNDAMDAQVKKDVISVIEEFQKGIAGNGFDLEPLNEQTVRIKQEAGQPKPSTPLYGEGESQKNSLINALAIRKIKNGYRLYRRRAKHYKADLPLNVLLAIHEYGALIPVTEKMRSFLHYIGIHLSPNTKIVRIPPRPVVDKAIIKALKKKRRNENVKKVKQAINKLIKTGDDSLFKKITAFSEKENKYNET